MQPNHYRMKGLFTLLFSVLVLCSFAQRRQVKGVLQDSATLAPVSFASITNLNSGKTAITNSSGLFEIEVGTDDILSFSSVGYHFDTIHYSGRYLGESPLMLMLKPLVNALKDVTVRTKGYSLYQLDSIERRKEFLAEVGAVKIPAISQANSGAGIAFNLDRYSKREKKKRSSYDFFDNNEKEEYINYRFTQSLVNEYTGLQGDSLQTFMQQYRPDFEWLRTHLAEEDLKYYINDNLKAYFKREN